MGDKDLPSGNPGAAQRTAFGKIEKELVAFADEERKRLGLSSTIAHWRDPDPRRFTRDQRRHTTILFGGLTEMHDAFIEATVAALGYKAKALPCPDNQALQLGKEFGNRAQCNPTYFTSGNLLRYLNRLRHDEGLSTAEIVENYVFLTTGGCGPCRFGAYSTEYRKVLRDAGFPGFRVFDLRRLPADGKLGEPAGLEIGARFAIGFFRALLAADVLNMMGYRTRPYEVVRGSTDAALQTCKSIVGNALTKGHSVLLALRRCRRVFAKVEIDRLQPKPKVALIGEFWAMTTEGEGNYRLQRFLEDEGAECEVQLLAAWILYEIWCIKYDTRRRMLLRRAAGERHRNDSTAPLKTLFLMWLARRTVQSAFYCFARALGLREYRLPDIEAMTSKCEALYPNELQGGEGNLEVGKVIEAVTRRQAHMVVSVKPFGCMPSSGVSDGIQSLVVTKYPEAIFCPVETSGDGAVSVYSRVQMALFRARAKAEEEFDQAAAAAGLSPQEAVRKAGADPRLRTPLHYPRHAVAGTAANAILERKIAATARPLIAS